MLYLLGTQAFEELCRTETGPVPNWLKSAEGKGVRRTAVLVSCMSWVLIQRSVAAERAKHNDILPPRNANQIQRISNVFDYFAESDSILPITYDAVKVAHTLLAAPIFYTNDEGRMTEIDYPEKLVLSTAITGYKGEQIVLVEKFQPPHNTLREIGLTVEDPYG